MADQVVVHSVVYSGAAAEASTTSMASSAVMILVVLAIARRAVGFFDHSTVPVSRSRTIAAWALRSARLSDWLRAPPARAARARVSGRSNGCGVEDMASWLGKGMEVNPSSTATLCPVTDERRVPPAFPNHALRRHARAVLTSHGAAREGALGRGPPRLRGKRGFQPEALACDATGTRAWRKPPCRR